MAGVCCDTSYLISLYGRDPNTARARRELALLAQPILLTEFNNFEMLNAIESLVFRRILDARAAALIFSAVGSDMAAGQLKVLSCDLNAVLAEGKRLSARWTRIGGHRTLDVLHVAAALHLQASEFLTFDLNQSRLATAEGLLVRP